MATVPCPMCLTCGFRQAKNAEDLLPKNRVSFRLFPTQGEGNKPQIVKGLSSSVQTEVAWASGKARAAAVWVTPPPSSGGPGVLPGLPSFICPRQGKRIPPRSWVVIRPRMPTACTLNQCIFFLIPCLPVLDTPTHPQMLQFQISINVNPWSESKGSFLFSALLFPPREFCWFSMAHRNHRNLGHPSHQGDKLLQWKLASRGLRREGGWPWGQLHSLFFSAFPEAHPSLRNDQTWLGNSPLSHRRTCWWPVTAPHEGGHGQGGNTSPLTVLVPQHLSTSRMERWLPLVRNPRRVLA